MKTWILLLFIPAFCACQSDSGRGGKNGLSQDTLFYTAPASRNISAKDSARLQASVQTYYDSMLRPRNFNGGILVAKGGHIVFENYTGTGHLGGTDPMNANMPLHLASITKTFTGTAILLLMERGKLGLDDEVNRYLPAFPYPGITIRMLLNHRSGLPKYDYFMEQLGWDKTKFVQNKDVLHYLDSLRPALYYTVGTRFAYCNTNYALLALIIEKISGTDYPGFLQKVFFGPIGMTNSFVFTPSKAYDVIPSYDWKGRLMDFNFLDAVYGDKNIYSTPRDMLKWDEALKSGQVLKKETLEAAYRGYSHEKAGIRNYGLGWRLFLLPNGKRIVYHNGWWHGNNTSFVRLPEEDAVIIVLGNRFCRSIYTAVQLSSLFGDYLTQPEEMEDNISPDTLNTRKPQGKDSLPQKKISGPAPAKTIPAAPKKKKNQASLKEPVTQDHPVN